MKYEMFEFIYRTSGLPQPRQHYLLDRLNPMSPYTHYGAPKPLTRFEKFNTNPHGPGYSMHPELTRRNIAAPVAYLAGVSPATYAAVAGFIGPVFLMATATVAYPEVAGPQWQSAMSGQPNIGSSVWSVMGSGQPEHWTDAFTWSYWQGY